MSEDLSNGWDAVAEQLIAAREHRRIGAARIRRWARQLPFGARVVDLGCGAGVPVTEELLAAGCTVSGIDPSPSLISAYAARFPEARAACETAEDTAFFGETFDAIVAVGLLFLLPDPAQRRVIGRVARALDRSGRFLFTAPAGVYPPWSDSLTHRLSVSLGKDGYVMALGAAGLQLVDEFTDEGDNHYFDCVKAEG